MGYRRSSLAAASGALERGGAMCAHDRLIKPPKRTIGATSGVLPFHVPGRRRLSVFLGSRFLGVAPGARRGVCPPFRAERRGRFCGGGRFRPQRVHLAGFAVRAIVSARHRCHFPRSQLASVGGRRPTIGPLSRRRFARRAAAGTTFRRSNVWVRWL